MIFFHKTFLFGSLAINIFIVKKIILFFFLIFSVLELNAQKIEPKYSFNVELGLPVTIANTPFNDVMQGLLGVSLYQQYSFPFHLNVGLGARYSLFTINEFRVPVPLNGSVHTTGAFMKIGYDKFFTERFAIDIGVKVGYSLNFSETKERNLTGDIINKTSNQNESVLIEPTLGLILAADEKTSYRFTIGYNIQGYGFSPRFIGLESDSTWDPSKYSTPTQYLVVGFGFTYYFRKEK